MCLALGVFPSSLPQAREGVTALPGSKMPFQYIWKPKEGSGRRGQHRSSQPGPCRYQIGALRGALSALETGGIGTTLAEPPSLQDVPPSPAPPWMAPGAVGLGPSNVQPGWVCPALGAACLGGYCKHPKHASTKGWEGGRYVGHPSPWSSGTLGWANGVCVGVGGPWPIPMGYLKLRLLFAAPL